MHLPRPDFLCSSACIMPLFCLNILTDYLCSIDRRSVSHAGFIAYQQDRWY